MKCLLMTLAMISLTACAGCNQGTPGGPGTTNDAPIFGQKDNTFNLTTPMSSTTLRQGSQIEATIGVERSGRFKKDVILSFSELPKDLTVEPANPLVKYGSHETKITFKAQNDTPLGDFKVKVTGHPPVGADAENIFKLSVRNG